MKKVNNWLAGILSLMLLFVLSVPMADAVATTENTTDLEEEVEEVADEMDVEADNLDSENEEEVADAIEAIEDDIDEIEDELDDAQDEYDVGMHRDTLAKMRVLMLRIKVAHKNHNRGQLTALKNQLRNLIASFKKAEIKTQHRAEVLNKIQNRIQTRKIPVENLKKQVLLSVRWGQIETIESDATVTSQDWNGSVSVKNGKIALVNPILFEENDEVTGEDETQITFDSKIAGHMDGLLIKVFPAEDGTYDETVLTVSFDEQSGLTYDKNDFQDGAYKEEVDENGQGVIIEKRVAGQVANAVVNRFKERNRNQIEDLLEKLDEDAQDDIAGLLEELDEDVQDDFADKREKFQGKLDGLMKHLVFVKKEKREDLLEQKLAVLAEAEDLEALIDELGLSEEVQAILEEVLALIEEYNFDATTAVKVTKRVQQFIAYAEQAGLSEEEIEAKIEELKADAEEFKNQAKGLKFNQGIIPFKDTEDTDWFTQYVSYVKAKNIVGGYKDVNGNALGEFRPGNNVTVAEVLKMALEAAEIDADNSGDPENKNVIGHWAEDYFYQAEQLGLTLTKDTNANPNYLANRGEVIRLILEVLGIEPDAVTSTDFSDVLTSNENAAYIQYAKEAGVISGDANKNTFRPYAPINRAEVAKIMQNMIEILKTAVDVED